MNETYSYVLCIAGTQSWKCMDGGEWDLHGPNTIRCWSDWTEAKAGQISDAIHNKDNGGILEAMRFVGGSILV